METGQTRKRKHWVPSLSGRGPASPFLGHLIETAFALSLAWHLRTTIPTQRALINQNKPSQRIWKKRFFEQQESALYRRLNIWTLWILYEDIHGSFWVHLRALSKSLYDARICYLKIPCIRNWKNGKQGPDLLCSNYWCPSNLAVIKHHQQFFFWKIISSCTASNCRELLGTSLFGGSSLFHRP